MAGSASSAADIDAVRKAKLTQVKEELGMVEKTVMQSRHSGDVTVTSVLEERREELEREVTALMRGIREGRR